MSAPPPNVPFPTLGGKQLWADVFLFAGFRIQQNVLTTHHRLLDRSDVRRAWGTYEHCHAAFQRLRRSAEPTSDHQVILLHGLFRSKDAFSPMTRALRRAGYEAASINYPSTRRTLDALVDGVELLLNRLQGVQRISFVTHSLGGIVARAVLARDSEWRERISPHRLVMIATPNQGAALVDRMRNWLPFQIAAGPVGQQLGFEAVLDVPRPTIPFGIVAGVRGDGHGFNPWLPGEDDFTVSLESAQLDGAEDTLLVEAVHTVIMRKPRVVAATVRYLDTGYFEGPTGSQ